MQEVCLRSVRSANSRSNLTLNLNQKQALAKVNRYFKVQNQTKIYFDAFIINWSFEEKIIDRSLTNKNFSAQIVTKIWFDFDVELEFKSASIRVKI